ncbi:phosphotransferase KptA/Tpt1, partial [Sphaerulina musiva SO2202]
RPPPPRPVQVSKKIAWLLRHGAEKEHLTLDSAGFANVHDVLENRNLKSLKVTFDELRACVRENDKQRFTLKLRSKSADTKDDDEDENEKESKNPSDYLIRANQGHSLKKIIQDQELLQPITATEENNIPAVAIHGTTKNAWKLIVASGGLKPMGRNHIHFAPGLPAEGKEKEKEKEKEIPVISGIRASSKILIYLDLAKAMQAGIKFWRSDNGVILSEGDENGLISMHFFQRVEDRTKEGGGAILIRDGKLL